MNNFIENIMMGFTVSDGLLHIAKDELDKVIKTVSILQVYDVDKNPLGRGKYATVRRAIHKTTGIHYAAKFVKRRRRNQDQEREIIHEIAVLLQCSTTNRVIRLHEVYQSATEMILVLELAAGGELQLILDDGHCLGEIEARKAMKQILEGVAYLHNKNIAHLDLKPQNLLLSVRDSCDDIKLCDFGISKVLQPGVTVREIIGTTDYVAPEVLNYDPISLAADVWSIGVLAYVLMSGYSPFGADDRNKTYLNIATCALSFEPEHFGDVSNTAIDFIKSALVVEPRKRPTVQSLLDHRWLSQISPLLPSISSVTATNGAIVEQPTTPLAPITLTSSIVPPSNSPVSQRRTSINSIPPVANGSSSSSSNSTPTTNNTNFSTLNGSYTDSTATVRTYSVSANCLCPQCGTTCRHITHTPVTKTTITIDRGILC